MAPRSIFSSMTLSPIDDGQPLWPMQVALSLFYVINDFHYHVSVNVRTNLDNLKFCGSMSAIVFPVEIYRFLRNQ